MVRFYPDMNLPHTHTQREFFKSSSFLQGLGETVKVCHSFITSEIRVQGGFGVRTKTNQLALEEKKTK